MAERDPIAQIHDMIVDFSRSTRLQENDMYHGLTFIAYATLTYVATTECPHAADIAGAYGVDKSTVSRQIADLQGQGLLDRVPDTRHPRMQKLVLTREGTRLLRHIRTDQRRRLDVSLAEWSASDVEAFSALFTCFVGYLAAPTAPEPVVPPARTAARRGDSDEKGAT